MRQSQKEWQLARTAKVQKRTAQTMEERMNATEKELDEWIPRTCRVRG